MHRSQYALPEPQLARCLQQRRYSARQVSGAAEGRPLLREPSRAPTRACSRFQRHSQPLEQPTCPCETTATRGDSGAPTDQKGTRGPTHTGAGWRLPEPETMVSPIRRPEKVSLSGGTPYLTTAPGILCPTSSTIPTPSATFTT